ncbi:MAG TPA: ABC transporter permease [Solirubrobacteraceae bacterium]
MLAGVLRRLLRTLVTLLVSSFLIFAALYLTPGSPLAFLTHGHSLSPEAIHSIEAQYHLNKPFLERYWLWLTGLLHGDLGRSTITREPVTTLLSPRIGVTLLLVAMGALLIVSGGIVLGVLAGVRGRRTDGVVLTVTTIGLAIPSFVTATILINYLALKLGWFPVYGAGSGFADRVWHLTLPAISLALGLVAYVALITRAAVRVEMGSDHSETARSRGLREGLVIRRHVVRNALLPIVTVSGITVASLVAGVAVVEKAYELPGIGAYLVDSVSNNDFPVVQAICLILVVVYVVVNAVVDVTYLLLDPRLRTGRR